MGICLSEGFVLVSMACSLFGNIFCDYAIFLMIVYFCFSCRPDFTFRGKISNFLIFVNEIFFLELFVSNTICCFISHFGLLFVSGRFV